MAGNIRLGKIAGLEFSAGLSALIGAIILWIVFGIIGSVIFRATVTEAIIGGFLATLLHWIGELLHQLGHAFFAWRTGHPMIGIRFWGFLSSSLYPANEPPLPASVHIKRALGGPRVSLWISVVALLVAMVMFKQDNTYWWVAALFFLDDLFIFTLGSFVPLGFTDGSTLLRYWKHRKDPTPM